MNRPKEIYLENQIQVGSEKIGHTKEGLEYMIDHYKHLLTTGIDKRPQDIKQHMEMLINKWEFHLELYKSGKI